MSAGGGRRRSMSKEGPNSLALIKCLYDRHFLNLFAGLAVQVYSASQVGAWRSPVSAPVWGTGGRVFKSRRPDQINQ
jgi:hypothetical protein